MVLPGVLLRALIPVGFMPVFGPGHSVTLMLCEGYAPVAPMAVDMPAEMSMDMPMAMLMDMSMPMGLSSGVHGQHGHPPAYQDHHACPYGASPTLAVLTHWADPAFAVEAPSQTPLAAAQISYAEISPRAQSPRGPPQEV
jgi:hypothetical protein